MSAMKRWLWSDMAIAAHFLCALVFACCLFELLGGGVVWSKSECLAGLALVVVVYPVLLWLIWSQHRADEREQQLLQALPVAEARRRRASQRAGMTVFAILGGGLCVVLGLFGAEAFGLPFHYIGFLLMGTAALGMCGVNVWYGGPLDPRNHPRAEGDHV